jgi:primosomal protein N' (replication factor Y)
MDNVKYSWLIYIFQYIFDISASIIRIMYYYEVLPGDLGFRGEEALTYCSDDKLELGTIVKIPLRNKLVSGLVLEKVNKPTFAVKKIIEAELKLPTMPLALVGLIKWIHAYYPGPIGAVAQLILPKDMPTDKELLSQEQTKKNSLSSMPKLTSEQISILSKVKEKGTYLLHGDTGTGKTRIYIELALKAFKKGRSVLVLTPEISLTSQLASNFRKAFGDNVIVIHSSLTGVEKRRSWLRIISSKRPLVVLGPRSALFSPIIDLGLIVVDEALEQAYKQD